MASIEEVAGGEELASRLAAHRARLEELKTAVASLGLDSKMPGDPGDPADVARSDDDAVAGDMRSAVRAYKRELVERALASSVGDHPAAARRLGVHPKYLYQLIRELDATPPPSSAARKKTPSMSVRKP